MTFIYNINKINKFIREIISEKNIFLKNINILRTIKMNIPI